MLVLFPCAQAVTAQGYTVAPAADWVKPVQPPQGGRIEEKNHRNGAALLLLDRQRRIGETQQSYYQHFVTKALNPSGVKEVSHISIDFDPSYQSLVLHQVTVHRHDRAFDRLERSQFNLIQREEDLEYQIYDGSKTLNIFIDDVRSGDIVEYSFTVNGENPVFAGHFSTQLDLRWAIPVARVHYRILWPRSRVLHIRNHKTDMQPIQTSSQEHTEYTWVQDDVHELLRDANTPDWHEPYPAVFLSDMADWNEVIAWAEPLYRPDPDTPKQRSIIAGLLNKAKTSEERLLAALRFVQDEVRYLGIEMGERSHKPNMPDVVLDQRFGDCKDKSRLLVSLLQGMNIEASPALVNSYNGQGLVHRLPTPAAFDHAIVVARIGGKNHWIDPTRNHQRGGLETLYKPDFDYALIVSGKNPGLTRMSDDVISVHTKVVDETLDISKAPERPASYKIITHHDGYYADFIRRQISETNPRQLQKHYLNYTARYFPDVEIAENMEIVDDPSRNRVTTTERYTIPDMWDDNVDDRYILAAFEPFVINDHIKIVDYPKRTMPLAMAHPVQYKQTTRIIAPPGSIFEKESTEVNDKAFRLKKNVDFVDGVLIIDYLYESLSDHVKPEDIQTHSENIRAASNLAYYQIQMPNPDMNFGKYRFDVNDVNWGILLLAAVTLILATAISHRFIFLYDPPYQAANEVNEELEGLRGWLVLFGLVVILGPIRLAIGLNELAYVFSAVQWSIVADRLGTGLLIMVVYEVMVNVVLIVLALYLLAMFFTRRHTFPRFFIAFMVLSLSIAALDALVLYLLSYPGLELTKTEIGDLVRAAVSATIWSLYLLKSRRVKATFNRRLDLRRRDHAQPSEITGASYD